MIFYSLKWTKLINFDLLNTLILSVLIKKNVRKVVNFQAQILSLSVSSLEQFIEILSGVSACGVIDLSCICRATLAPRRDDGAFGNYTIDIEHTQQFIIWRSGYMAREYMHITGTRYRYIIHFVHTIISVNCLFHYSSIKVV